jgi:hypothetical protein
MNIEQIREIARQLQINPEGLSQTELIRAIQGNEGNVNCFGTSYGDQCGQYACLWREDCLHH